MYFSWNLTELDLTLDDVKTFDEKHKATPLSSNSNFSDFFRETKLPGSAKPLSASRRDNVRLVPGQFRRTGEFRFNAETSSFPIDDPTSASPGISNSTAVNGEMVESANSPNASQHSNSNDSPE